MTDVNTYIEWENENVLQNLLKTNNKVADISIGISNKRNQLIEILTGKQLAYELEGLGLVKSGKNLFKKTRLKEYFSMGGHMNKTPKHLDEKLNVIEMKSENLQTPNINKSGLKSIAVVSAENIACSNVNKEYFVTVKAPVITKCFDLNNETDMALFEKSNHSWKNSQLFMERNLLLIIPKEVLTLEI